MQQLSLLLTRSEPSCVTGLREDRLTQAGSRRSPVLELLLTTTRSHSVAFVPAAWPKLNWIKSLCVCVQ